MLFADDSIETTEAAIVTVTVAKEALEQWKTAYDEVRDRIEANGDPERQEKRWEFNQKKLFPLTTRMAERCGEILEMAKVLDEYHHTLGPQLKAVTGDPANIDNVIHKVHQLRVSLASIDYDIFGEDMRRQWKRDHVAFNNFMADIDKKAVYLINESFEDLRSAHGTFVFLKSVEVERMREPIRLHLERKKDTVRACVCAVCACVCAVCACVCAVCVWLYGCCVPCVIRVCAFLDSQPSLIPSPSPPFPAKRPARRRLDPEKVPWRDQRNRGAVP